MPRTTLSGLSLLIVEDDLLLRKQIGAYLERMEADITGVAGLAEAQRLLAKLSFDFVLLDVHLPDGSGLDLFRQHVFPPDLPVIVMTADGGVAGAVEAVRLGAADYLVKPFDLGELPLVLHRASGRRQNARLSEQRKADIGAAAGDFFFGESLAELQRTLDKILEADRRIQTLLPPVLIQGETGTGKTTIARWVHHQGPRANQPLVEMNCSAVPETLAESELFGHERGAFTDARTSRIGLFEAADGGTLFLDELPSLSPPLQAKVLKTLEDHRIRRLGGRKDIAVDVRIIAATSSDLRQLAAQGLFREDLLHRLDLYRIILPPLRERGEDIVGLTDRLLERIARRHRLPGRRLTAEGERRLKAYAWPGNVRELAHELERALVFEEGPTLTLPRLPGPTPTAASPARPNPNEWFNESYIFPEHGFDLEEAIHRLIRRALAQTEGNVSAAARLLGVSRDYLRYRLAERKKANG